MNEEFLKYFDELAAKPSVVAHRKEAFFTKVEAFQNRPDLTELLRKEGLDKETYILLGMTIEGYFVHGTGINFFVANGYPPEGMSFFVRNHDGCCKIILSTCCTVNHVASRLEIYPICTDEDMLDLTKISQKMTDYILGKGGKLCGPAELCKIKLYNNSIAMLCWSRSYVNVQGEYCRLVGDIDSGCFIKLKETEIELAEPISFETQNVSSSFSAYLFNGVRLIRDEHSRSNGGVGVFFG